MKTTKKISLAIAAGMLFSSLSLFAQQGAAPAKAAEKKEAKADTAKAAPAHKDHKPAAKPAQKGGEKVTPAKKAAEGEKAGDKK